MRRTLITALSLAALALALPVVAGATHKPGHNPGGGPAPDLSIAAKPAITVYRGATVISGRLQGPGNAGQTVTLMADGYPFDGAKPDGTAVTDNKGDYTFTRRPGRNAYYHVVSGAKKSAPVLVRVRIRVSLFVSDSTPKRGQIVRFSGRACPTHDGLLVRIQRRGSDGVFRTVLRTRTVDASRCSVYSRRARVYRDGAFRVTLDDADHTSGISVVRTLDVHR